YQRGQRRLQVAQLEAGGGARMLAQVRPPDGQGGPRARHPPDGRSPEGLAPPLQDAQRVVVGAVAGRAGEREGTPLHSRHRPPSPPLPYPPLFRSNTSAASGGSRLRSSRRVASPACSPKCGRRMSRSGRAPSTSMTDDPLRLSPSSSRTPSVSSSARWRSSR